LTLLWTFCQEDSGYWKFGGASKWFNAVEAHENAIGSVTMEKEESGKNLIPSDFFHRNHTLYYSPTTTRMLCFTERP
jgi:hypothetical protein